MVWMIPILKYYRANPPNHKNMIPLSERQKYKEYFQGLESLWEEEKNKSKPSFLNVVWKVIGKDFTKLAVFESLSYDSLLLQSLVLIQVINYFENPNNELGPMWIVFFLLGTLIISLLLNLSNFKFYTMVTTVKGAITSLLYSKLLKISYTSANNDDTNSKIISVIFSDLELLENSFLAFYLTSFPLMVVGSFIIMGIYFGLAGILGLLYCIFQIPLVYFLSKPVKGYREKIAVISDERVNMIKMLIEGIRIVKIYGWESFQLKEIFEARKAQNQQTFRKNIFISVITGVGYSGLVIAMLITFSCFVIFGNELKASEVFAGTSILFLAFIKLNLLPDGLIQIFMLIVTFSRV